jgi:hypothetical protein
MGLQKQLMNEASIGTYEGKDNSILVCLFPIIVE